MHIFDLYLRGKSISIRDEGFYFTTRGLLHDIHTLGVGGCIPQPACTLSQSEKDFIVAIPGFEMEEGSKRQEWKQPLEAGKGKETDYLQSL